MKRLASYAAVVMGTLAVLLLLWEVRLVALAFLLSLFTAAYVRPLVERLTRRGVPLVAAMVLIYAAGLGAVLLALILLNTTLVTEIRSLSNDLAVAYERLQPAWLEGNAFQEAVASRLPPPEELFSLLTAQEGRLLASTLFNLLQATGTVAGGLILVLALSIYWSADSEHFERLWLSLLRPEQRIRARNVWRATEKGVGQTMRAETAQALLAAVLLGAGYWVMGIRYPALLALLGGLVWLVPMVGALFAVGVAFLGGLATSLPVAVISVAYTTAVVYLLGSVVEPRLFDRRRLYSRFLVVLLIVPLAQAWGILGFFAAPPLAVTIQSLLTNLFRHRPAQPGAPVPAAKVQALREQFEQLQERAGRSSEAPLPEVKSLMQRFEELLQVTEEALEQDAT